MPMDGLTLGFITREMQALLLGRIDKVTQPEKDMIVLSIRANNKNEKLLISASPSMTRFHLTEDTFLNPPDAPMFCMLLRKYLSGGRIQAIEQISGDRLIKITVDNRDELGETGARELWFEAMGRCSNLTLVMNGRIIDAIRHVGPDMSRVRQLLPGLPFETPPKQDKLAPDEITFDALYARLKDERGRLQKALLSHISGLSPVSAREMTLRASNLSDPQMEDVDIAAVCEKLTGIFLGLSAAASPVLLSDETGLRLDFFPFPYLSCAPDRQTPCPTLSAAMDRFFAGRDKIDRMAQKSAALKKAVRTHLERCEKKLALQEDELLESARADEFRLFGELLSAQLYLIKKGAKSATVQNFYAENNAPITIPLDETLSPAQNAQRYFKKYKKALAARKTAAEQKENTLKEIDMLETALLDIPNCEAPQDLSDIRRTLEDFGLLKRDRAAGKGKKNAPESKPYAFFASDGTPILVGKNSVQNERLTKNARGDDLWLHCKGMPGSHVIVCLTGRELTDATLLEAAKLAAY